MTKSIFELKRSLYENSPDFAKQLVGLVPFSLISGKAYRETMKADKQLDFASAEANRLHQAQLLKKILTYASDHVPFYRPFRDVVQKYAPHEALQEFPIIDKELVQERPDDFRSLQHETLPYYETTTGGTSGNQLKILLDNDSHYRETAFIHRLWSRVGYRPIHRKATFRGQVIKTKSEEVFWKLNPIYRELQFSTFHLAPDNIHQYVRKLNQYRPDYVHGYPSVVSTIANHLLSSADLELTASPKAVLLGSEATFDGQRELIEKAYRCRVYSWYGHSERLILGGECELNDSYHQLPDYGYAEILKADDTAALPGERGELVGTTFRNRIMPLIRYRTGDVATRLDSPCECGRNDFRFGSVQGRWNQEFLVGRSGAKIYSTALNMHGDAFMHVMRYQYVQTKRGELLIKIMPGQEFSEADKCNITNEFKARIGHDFAIAYDVVDDIPLTARGKFRRVIQEIRSEQ